MYYVTIHFSERGKKKEKKKKVVALLSTSHKVAVSHLVVEEELSLLCMVFCLLLN